MKKNKIILLVTIVFIAIIGTQLACNKSNENTNEQNNNENLNEIHSGIDEIELYYMNETEGYSTINFTQLQNLYYNNGIFDSTNKVLLSATILSALDDNGITVYGLSTKWSSPDGNYHSLVSNIHLTTDPASGLTINVLADNSTTNTTSTCECTSSCSSGCNVMFPGSQGCDCTSCFPSGTCTKKHTVVTVTAQLL